MSVDAATAGRGPDEADGPAGRATIHGILARSRSGLARLTPLEAHDAAGRGEGLIVDIRADSQIAEAGRIPGAIFIPRNVLEWRACPSSGFHDARLSSGRRVILICAEGYQSSLAAATLQELGLTDATDVIGGVDCWTGDGLPLERPG